MKSIKNCDFLIKGLIVLVDEQSTEELIEKGSKKYFICLIGLLALVNTIIIAGIIIHCKKKREFFSKFSLSFTSENSDQSTLILNENNSDNY